MMDTYGDSDYFRLFTARNAKFCSVGALVIVTVYHSLLKLHYGEDLCIGLLESGRYQGDQIWQPYGCMLHSYSQSNSRMCMKYNHYWGRHNMILFLGDQRTYQLYMSFVYQLNPALGESYVKTLPKLPDDNKFLDSELNLTVQYHRHTKVDGALECRFQKFASVSIRPSVIIVGTGMNNLGANETTDEAKKYGHNISLLLPYIEQIKDTSRVLFLIQTPVVESKVAANFSSLTNAGIELFNEEARNMLLYTPVRLWESVRLLALGNENDSPDGFLLGPTVLNYATQILLNFYCNDLMNYPDGTCCSHDETLTVTQIVVICLLSTFIAAGFCIFFSRCRRKLRQTVQKLDLNMNGEVPKSSEIGVHNGDPYICLVKLCGLLLFVFVADRSGLYMKENKWFTYFNFFLPVGYLGVLGLFFTESVTETAFMYEELNNELKGWMLLVLLVYNMTGAEKVLWTYMLYNCLVSCLLFMVGYEQFTHFWSNNDFSLRKLFTTLFKFNFVGVLLCITMNRPYQFYSILPLLSYWYCVGYLMLAIPPQVSASSTEANGRHYFYLVVKFVLLFCAISVLYLSEVFFENLFITRPWKALFVLSDDSIQSWWFNWSLHRYSLGYGMLFAFIIAILRQFGFLADSQPCNLFSRRMSIFAFLCCCIGLGSYVFILYRCKTKSECAEIHAYVSCIPIISYLLMRNLFGCIRVRLSSFFAWFGRLWLELLVVHYHVWLAADTAGILVLFPRWPVFNVILTSFIFVCIAHELHSITLRLVPVVVPTEDPRKLIRNLVLVSLLGVPLGFLYGVF